LKKTLKGYLLGFLTATLLLSGVVYAASNTKTIEAIYDNIKIYKDNVLCETKDANGNVVEPFIYNGTTYMPVRGTANLAGMDVTWDGATKSVYLWDEMIADETYLLASKLPYDKSKYCDVFLSSEGKSFEMSGNKYSNGIRLGTRGSFALFNLDSKYSTMEFTIGHISHHQNQKTIYFIVDGKTVKEVTISSEAMPRKISVPLNYGLQLKIVADDVNQDGYTGIANIIVK